MGNGLHGLQVQIGLRGTEPTTNWEIHHTDIAAVDSSLFPLGHLFIYYFASSSWKFKMF